MKKAAFYSLGCKVNQYETEAMIDLFKKAGYEIVDFTEMADYYIINSCTVTNQAASKSRKRARRAKRRNPNSSVVMVGCYPQAFTNEVCNIDEVDYMIGASGKENIVELLENNIKNLPNDNFLTEINKYSDITEYENMNVEEINQMTRANVKIEDGCNQFCSYCIIPYARGPVKSRPFDLVIAEVKHLIDNGIKEIVLTGTHLGNYGLDQNRPGLLSNLVEKIAGLDGDFRLRLSSIEVTEIDAKLIALIRKEEKICSHLHLPLQSGSNIILNEMNRPYTREDFADVAARLRKEVPDIGLTTDVIVGFPGESDKDFEKSYNFIEEMKFSRVHVFPFSPRNGTPAADMKAKIHGDIKKKRSKKLINLNKQLMKEFQEQFIGSERKVVIEDSRDHKTGLLKGVTDNYIHLLIDGSDSYKNKLIDVKVSDSHDFERAIGKIIKN